MIEQPVLGTRRLQLRPPESSDLLDIQKQASFREIADTMISLPHPYPPGEAGKYLDRMQHERTAGRAVVYLIERRAEKEFCGLIEIRDIDHEHSQGELSFWLERKSWGVGYMSESVEVMVRYGFEVLRLNRLFAYHMLRNPATGRVLEKSGFRQEGVLRQRVRKWGQFEDVALWAILRQDWNVIEEHV
jgi:ribosomal-protein-alanine N-acetyltransferase